MPGGAVLGKMLIVGGLLLVLLGVVLLAGGKLPGLGRLPGDIVIVRENFRFYFPITTGLLLSLVVSLILFLFSRWK